MGFVLESFHSVIGDYHTVGSREKWEVFDKVLEEIACPFNKIAKPRMKGGAGGLGEALIGRNETSR